MGPLARAATTLTAAWAGALTLNRSLRRIRGDSMAPTLAAGDVVLTMPVRRPRRGEIVLLRDPRNQHDVHVKRVLALPGETLRVVRGRLLVDGVGQVEPYADGVGPDGRLVVPPDHVAVLGDARTSSTDSRTYGPVPMALVDARVVARVRPWPRLLRSRPRGLSLAVDDRGAA